MTRVGSQRPTARACAPYPRTYGPAASKLADAYGIAPHEWQRMVLSDMLAVGADGRFVNNVCLLHVPRQNGKTGVVDPRETFGLVALGEHILHTAQEFQTAKVGFDRLRAKFGQKKNDPNARFPEMNALVERYTTSANQMALDLTNGGHIEFRTRGSGDDVGRGGTYDLIVVDEAQSYTEGQDAALSPLNSAAPLGNPQTVLMGTSPDPERPHLGAVFSRMLDSVQADSPDGFCMWSWTVPEPGDPTDRDRWYATNPSLGFQLLESALAKDSLSMAPERFAMEHLGWRPKLYRGAMPAIPAAQWERCYVAEPPKDGLKALGVKFSPDGRVAVAAARRLCDGSCYVELLMAGDTERGLRDVTRMVTDRRMVDTAAAAAVDGRDGADTLAARMREAGWPRRSLPRVGGAEAVAAASLFATMVKERTLTHWRNAGQAALDQSALTATKRRIGRDGWGFDGDSAAVEAAALAVWAAVGARDGTRSGGIGC